MTTLLFLFLISLGLSLVLTPLINRVGVRLGAVDIPTERKVHTAKIPRIGGLAVFLSFVITVGLTQLYVTSVSELLVFDKRTAFAFMGALVVFGCGLWDDFHQVNPWIKLLFQILGATIAFVGGISIERFFLGFTSFDTGIFSYAVTVFWFVLFINAVNLIDGLDGLAGGVIIFTSLLMVVLSVMRVDYLHAMYFAILCGAVLGFLRYNFNPASIFLGDGGSYFLGYTVAALSIMGSVKSQVGALMLIPLLALGVPVFDTILSPLRRWVKGRGIFQPDKEHIHHRLLAAGLSSRNAVLILYGVTLALCLLAILIVNVRNEFVGLILLIIGIGALVLVHKTDYLGYLALDKIYGWFRDMTDVVGFSRERRTFLALQIDADRTRTMEGLLTITSSALEMLKFDRAELHMKLSEISQFSPSPPPGSNNSLHNRGKDLASSSSGERGDTPVHANPYNVQEQRRSIDSNAPPPKSEELFQDMKEVGDEIVWTWTRGYYRRSPDLLKEEMMKIYLPLNEKGNGKHLVLMKDLGRNPLDYFTLRRLEHLRRTLHINLSRLQKQEKDPFFIHEVP